MNAVKNKEERIRTNKQIRSDKVKVLNAEGEFIGVMETYKAIKLAQEKGLDLVETNGKIYPPLVKIIEVGKYKYEMKQQQKEQKKNQKVQAVKALFFHPNTEEFDINRQVEQAREFLKDGHSVRFTIKFRGREMTFLDIGKAKLEMVLEKLADVASFHTPISTENRNMTTLISPKA